MLLYSPRDPRKSPLYQLTEDYVEDFESCYDERYQHEYGYWRPVIHDVLYKFLDCGNLHQGFARVRCEVCGSEHLLAFSCKSKTRCFCPSCNQRRSLEFGELIAEKLMSWHHSGFHVHIGSVISPDDKEGRERAARYLVRPPISLEKMQYFPDEDKVIYGKPRGEKKIFAAMDFLALAASHIANRFEHRVVYYGWWSNKMRGMRKKKEKLIEGQLAKIFSHLS